MNPARTALIAVLLLIAHLPSARADSAAYDRTLDALADMVSQYEQFAAKQTLCLSDVNALNINLLPALTRASNEAQAAACLAPHP